MPSPPPQRPFAQNPFRVLIAHRNFRLFWVGQTISLVGMWMRSVAIGWLALQLTDSAFWVAVVAVASSLPVLLLSLYGGLVADRNDKLRVVTIAQGLLLLNALALWWFVASNNINIAWLFLLALAGGAISAFEIPARQSFIIDLVGRDDLTDAIALNSSGFNLARVLGPSIAGVVIASAGLAWCFALNALSYGAVLAGLLAIRLPRRVLEPPTSTPWEGLVQGLSYVVRTPEVWALMRMVGVNAIFGIPYLTLMPVIARDVLGSDASGYGLLLTCVGIGGFSGAIGLAALGRTTLSEARRGRLLERSSYAFAGLLLLFSLSRSMALSTVLVLGVGFTMILTNALANAMLQSSVPDGLRGRVMSVYVWVFVGLGPVVGPFIAGAAAERIGASSAVGIGALAMLAYNVFAFWRRPEMRGM
ncbi:MAG: MFS transporter [Gemmatimonadaceae bacterium]